MTRQAARWLVIVALLAMPVAAAEPDDDHLLIPDALRSPADTEPPTPSPGGTIYLEEALTLTTYRDSFVVPPPAQPRPNWQNRLSLDVRRTVALEPGLNATYSGRLNVLAADGRGLWTDDNVRHDLREAFASWEPLPQDYLDLGRINFRNGVALGFNPTDFFKTRAVVDRVSNDPTVLRENRLGTAMLRAQSIGDGRAFSFAYAPSFSAPTPVYGSSLPSLNPMFDRTNAAHRFLAKASADLAEDFSPEILLYRERGHTRIGANLTRSIGSDLVAYGEWAGGRRASLIEDAFRYGQETGTLPAVATRVLPGRGEERFRHDLAIGAAYTAPAKVMANLEYHFHEAGLSRRDWRNWFDIGGANAGSRPVTGQLWYLRSYALEQQEPMTRHAFFLRAEWTDAFATPGLKLSGLTNINAYDGSRLIQLQADYYWTDRWTLSALAAANVGTDRSERGSLPQAASLILKAIRYF